MCLSTSIKESTSLTGLVYDYRLYIANHINMNHKSYFFFVFLDVYVVKNCIFICLHILCTIRYLHTIYSY